MASVTENKGSAMEDEAEARDDDREEREEKKPEKLNYRGPQPPVKTDEDKFFHIRKAGQGYWTRMLTALGAGLFIAGTIYFLYRFVLSSVPNNVRLPIVAASAVALSVFAWYMMNKPISVDFLIATDSEMKKVNWTSRQELMGSTKVVILFMFLIAFMLFAFDIFFGYLFKWIHVLKHGPFD